MVLACLCLHAQFSVSGSDPASVRWMQMESPTFWLIYPAGGDSLAMVYGNYLEKAGIAVGWSSGRPITTVGKTKIPVVLHSFYPVSNASVAWAPKRMDIFTVMDPYAPTPIKWEKLLAIHEGRHVSQMMSLEKAGGKMTKLLFGELFTGAMAGIYPGPALLEGDAVTAETALTNSGRGRQASFLSYMMPAFDCGEWRNYWRWSLGSDRVFTPDYYRAGYMLVAGTRVFFDAPLFTEEYFTRIKKKLTFFNMQKTVKSASGLRFRKAFRSIEEQFHGIWAEEASARAPFMPSRQVSPAPWRHSFYAGPVVDDNLGIWSKKTGLTTSESLVLTKADGSEQRIRSFSRYSSNLAFHNSSGRIFWSEPVFHWRWPMAGSSRIRYIDTSSPKKIHDLTKVGRYFNPAPSPDGNLISVTEYPTAGGSRIVLLNVSDGSEQNSIQAPDSIQFTESAWIEGRLFAAGLSDNGMGIYEVLYDGQTSGRTINTMLGPQPVELSCLRPFDAVLLQKNEGLSFVCDRTGVNEAYFLDVESGKLFQLTSSRYGIGNPVAAADSLYFTSVAKSEEPSSYKMGHMLYATAMKDLPVKEVSFSDIHDYRVASVLRQQEEALSGNASPLTETTSQTTFSQPRKFRRGLPKIHSWAPLFFDYDNLESISGDDYYKSASLGATVLFQNLTGDGYGFIGYSAHEDPYGGGWRNSGHFKYIYTGLMPVFEVSASFGDRAARTLGRIRRTNAETKTTSFFTSGTNMETPFLEGQVRVYLPVNLSSGGISRGIVPQVKYNLSNDVFCDRISIQEIVTEKGKKVVKEIGSVNGDLSSNFSTLDLSIRGYIMRSAASSQVYPRLGIGAEAGLRFRPRLSNSFAPTAYLYTYAYLPGLLEDHGIRLTATAGKDLGGGIYSFPETSASFIPRGFVDSNLRSVSNSFCPSKYKLSFDYAAPLLYLDWAGLSPMAYIKTVTVSPFADFAFQESRRFDNQHKRINGSFSERMYSVGVDLTFKLGNFFWLPYDSSIGVRYAYNGWSALNNLPVSGLEHHYFGSIFKVSI